MAIEIIEKDGYPYLLKQLKKLPRRLYVEGSIPSDDHKFLCVIGSRTYSSYGKDVCKHMISGLQGYPIVIVSGLAVGIDSMAHEAALEAGLKTVAFPGSGLSPEVIYPPSKRPLARRIVEAGGALISPFKPDREAAHWTFPVRNELMAGMSHAVLIIEGRKGSGTLLTAKNALELGRDVLIVPGSIFSELSYGPHFLFRDGATPAFSSKDILRALDFDVAEDDAYGEETFSIDLDRLSITSDERKVLECLGRERLSASDLMDKASLPPSGFNVIISGLEVRGLVAESEGVYRIKNS